MQEMKCLEYKSMVRIHYTSFFKLRNGSISQSACPWQAFPIYCNISQAASPIITLSRKWDVVNRAPGANIYKQNERRKNTCFETCLSLHWKATEAKSIINILSQFTKKSLFYFVFLQKIRSCRFGYVVVVTSLRFCQQGSAPPSSQKSKSEGGLRKKTLCLSPFS